MNNISVNTIMNPVCLLSTLDSKYLDKYKLARMVKDPDEIPLAKRLEELERADRKQGSTTEMESKSKMEKKRKNSSIEADEFLSERPEIIDLKNDDPHKIIKSLMHEVEYYRQAAIFHKNNGFGVKLDRDKAEARIADLDLELKRRKKKQRRLVEEIAILKTSNKELHPKLMSNMDNAQSKEDKEVIVHSTDEQTPCITKEEHCAKWSVDDYATAICLRSVSQAAYTYMCKSYKAPLPPLASLRKWALTEFCVPEGFSTDILTLMREKGKSLSPLKKIGVITFGEMNLTPEICYDAKLAQMIGPCSKVFVIMVRGLLSNWKQPIYHVFDQPISKAILLKAISLLYEAGYQVVAVTCDVGNTAVWKELEITTKNHHFPHPRIDNAFVYAFADVPNLLKLLRNSFFDEGLVAAGSNEKFTGAVLQNLIDHKEILAELGGSHRITKRVMEARNTLTQAVWPASRVWSHSVAKAVELAGRTGLLGITEYQKLSDLVQVVNDWFDVFNSKMPHGKHRGVDAYGIDVRSQERILLLMTVFMQNMRVGGRETLMPFQDGVIISNASLKGLHSFLKGKFPNDYKYLITRRLQRDVVENFFSQIRDMEGPEQPQLSGYDFGNRLRSYVSGKSASSIRNDNSRLEEESNMSCIFGESPNSLANCSPHQTCRTNDFCYVPNTPSRSSGGFSVLSVPRRANEYYSDPVLPNSTSRNTITQSFTRPGGLEELCANSCVDEPTYQYEADPHDLVILTAELLADIINSSTDSAQDIDNAKDLS